MSSAEAAAVEQQMTSHYSWWKPLLTWKFIVLLSLTVLVYQGVLFRLVTQWSNDPNFSHGFIVPLFSAFVLWTKRAELAAAEIHPSSFGLVVIVGSLLLLIVGSLGAELFLARTSLVFLLGGMTIYFCGWRQFRIVSFPWAFLFLMIPIPVVIFNQITFPLQTLAAKLAAAALQGIGIVVLREGNIITLPAMQLEVAEACSGIRSLLSLGTLAIMYGYFLETRMAARVLLALAAIPIAVFANGFRVFGTGVLVQYWDPDKALGFFHEFSGWLIFLVSLLLLTVAHKGISALWSLSRRWRHGE